MENYFQARFLLFTPEHSRHAPPYASMMSGAVASRPAGDDPCDDGVALTDLTTPTGKSAM